MHHRKSKASAGNGAGKNAVTRSELESLNERQRDLSSTLTYTPGGSVEYSIHRMEEMRRAVRAGFIRERLGREEGRAVNDFELAKTRGLAERDFERSR